MQNILGVVMKTVAVRCTKCKKRYTLKETFKDHEFSTKAFQCTCGNRGFFKDKWMANRGSEQRCDCAGYHFPHRKGSKFCHANPMSKYHEAKERYQISGAELDDIVLDCAWENEQECTSECPF